MATNNTLTFDLTLILTHSPYGSAKLREALDVAISALSFDLQLCVILKDDARLLLTTTQSNQALWQKNMQKQFSVLPIYGLEHLYCFEECSAMPQQAEIINTQQFAELIANSKQVMVF